MNIRKKIKKIARKALYFLNSWKWYYFYRSTIKKKRKLNFIRDDDWYTKGKILLIAPHADDELLSSYTLLKRAPNITVYYCGFIGSNNEDENIITRHNEIKELCKEMKVSLFDGAGTCNNLVEIIKKFDTIVIPSIVDWHAEHRKVSYLLFDIIKNTGITPNIYSYSVTVPNESEQNVICVPMTKEEQRDKYSLFKKIYYSQRYMPLYRFCINERVNAHSIDAYASETFFYYTLNSWLKEIKFVQDAEDRNDTKLMNLIFKLSANLGNMQKTRNFSRKMYSIIQK